jgi:hypothetical protein
LVEAVVVEEHMPPEVALEEYYTLKTPICRQDP